MLKLNGNVKIELDNLQSGLYFIRVFSGEGHNESKTLTLNHTSN